MEIPKTPETSYIIGRFKELIAEGLGSHDIRDELRLEGLRFSNATASKIYQGIIQQNPLDVRFLPGNEIPSPEAFNISNTTMPTRYGFLVGITTEDMDTGEYKQGLHMIFQEDLDTIDNILERAQQTLEESYYQGSAIVVRIDIINAYSQ